VLLQVITCWQL